VILAELEVYHSRPIAPTRRVALGRRKLPVDPAPGFGGILLGGIVANFLGGIDPDLHDDLAKLIDQLEHGLRIPQPRLRHRFQKDKVGLQASTHRLVGDGEVLTLDLDERHGDPAQQVLGAVYAAGALPPSSRRAVMATLRQAMGWTGPVDDRLISVLAGFRGGAALSTYALHHPVEWALETLGVANGGRAGAAVVPARAEIQRAYRRALISAHPDHGGDGPEAAQRIADLGEARRILLG
jgi:hypothetical protein